MQKPTRSERKLAMREEARQKVRGVRGDAKGVAQYADAVGKGLARLRQSSAEGGDAAAKRIKSELNYLLNNYLPRYDVRIEQLIDAWRRTGDPGYDPSIRIRFRQARREHMAKSNPL